MIVEISLTEAKGRLTDLVRRAEAGDDVILTRHGRPAARIVPIDPSAAMSPADRRHLLEDIWLKARDERIAAGEDDDTAARSQDFLYDEDGMPG